MMERLPQMMRLEAGLAVESMDIVRGNAPVAVAVFTEAPTYFISPASQARPVVRPALLHPEDVNFVFDGTDAPSGVIEEAKKSYMAGCEYIKRAPLRARARLEFEKVLDALPGHFYGLMRLAQLRLLDGDAAAAERKFATLSRKLEGFDEFHFYFGNALYLIGKAGEAEGRWNRTLQLNPRYAEALNNLGVALAAGGGTKQAEKKFEQALLLFPDYADAAFNLVRVCRLGDAASKLRLTRRNISIC